MRKRKLRAKEPGTIVAADNPDDIDYLIHQPDENQSLVAVDNPDDLEQKVSKEDLLAAHVNVEQEADSHGVGYH